MGLATHTHGIDRRLQLLARRGHQAPGFLQISVLHALAADHYLQRVVHRHVLRHCGFHRGLRRHDRRLTHQQETCHVRVCGSSRGALTKVHAHLPLDSFSSPALHLLGGVVPYLMRRLGRIVRPEPCVLKLGIGGLLEQVLVIVRPRALEHLIRAAIRRLFNRHRKNPPFRQLKI
ncbi:hypothetical protein [Mycobacteroides abscessus]|uniref:hypothetical protein n=1 Tax=Mycobacteroides abscessus TaxID=36809 RepID=UPI00104E487F|nr:hypothetical protein [Mycobacteroides abscessus]